MKDCYFLKKKIRKINNISIVIPTYNEIDYLLHLLESIKKIDYPLNSFEIIVVSDGSEDGTVKAVRDSYLNVKLIDLPTNIGRYQARKIGAEVAKFDNILFIDSRTLVDPGILNIINQTDYKAINGVVESGNPKNHFQIFFKAIRRRVYPKFYTNPSTPIEINQSNFDSLPKGTTVFFVQKDILFIAYNELSKQEMGKLASDDTKMIRKIVEYTPILLHPGVKITHFVRKTFYKNFLHLIWRGSTFVDYYLDPSKRQFWLVIIFPFLALTSLFVVLISLPIPWTYKFGFIIIVDILIAAYLAKNVYEILVISYILPACVTSFYLGIFRGIFLKIFSIIKLT